MGRIATAIVVILGVLWIPIMANISGVLYEYLQKVQSYIAPPITAVFLIGVFHKRINSQGAYATLVSGFVVGSLRIILELTKDSFAEGTLLHTLATMNFLTFGAYFFLVSVIILVGVSLFTPAQTDEQVRGLTFGTLTPEQKQANKNSYNWVDVVTSLIVVGVVIYVMTTFTG
jgi:SSS family solute:Na+ symporter